MSPGHDKPKRPLFSALERQSRELKRIKTAAEKLIPQDLPPKIATAPKPSSRRIRR